MAELEELEQEELDKNLLEISGPETVRLPSVPSISIPSKPGEYLNILKTGTGMSFDQCICQVRILCASLAFEISQQLCIIYAKLVSLIMSFV